MIPLSGLVLGLLAAFAEISGFLTPWHKIGNPPERIERIIGNAGGYFLHVETVTGGIYSLRYTMPHSNYPSIGYLLNPPWEKVNKGNVTPDAEQRPYSEFRPPPLLIPVKQYYDVGYPGTEGDGLIQFAVTNAGDLWFWHYYHGGFYEFYYCIFPGIGLLAAIIILAVNRYVFARSHKR